MIPNIKLIVEMIIIVSKKLLVIIFMKKLYFRLFTKIVPRIHINSISMPEVIKLYAIIWGLFFLSSEIISNSKIIITIKPI